MGQSSDKISRHNTFEASECAASNVFSTTYFVRYSNCFPSTVGAKYHILRQKIDEVIHLTCANGLEKSFQQIVLLPLWNLKARPHRTDMLTRSTKDLTAVGLALTKNYSYLCVLVLEDIAEK